MENHRCGSSPRMSEPSRRIDLRKCLGKKFGVLNSPVITEEWICERVKKHRERTGTWPRAESGQLLDVPDETWGAINASLRQGYRGLPGGSSLPKFLEKHFGVPNGPDITEEWICERVTIHRERTGKWPTKKSGHLLDAPEENWSALDAALSKGFRGLPGGSSLSKFLKEQFGASHRSNVTEESICERAKNHRKQTGKWPTTESGRILDAPDETWNSIQVALRQGHRGLPGGSSLSKLLNKYFGVTKREGR